MSSPLTCARGDTLAATLYATQADNVTPFDLTGWTLRWTAKPAQDWVNTLDAGATLTATVGSGLTVLSNPGGTMSLLIAASTMASVPPGVYVWDLQASAAGVVHTLILDSLTITADVSRTTP